EKGERRRGGKLARAADEVTSAIEQVELAVFAIPGTGVADFRVAQVRLRIDKHLGDLVTEGLRIAVPLVRDVQVLTEDLAVAVRLEEIADRVVAEDAAIGVRILGAVRRSDVVENDDAAVV